jgi:hypothetical protein
VDPQEAINKVADQVRAAKPELLRVVAEEQPASAPRTVVDELPTTADILTGFPTVTEPPPPRRAIGGTLFEWRLTAGQVLHG